MKKPFVTIIASRDGHSFPFLLVYAFFFVNLPIFCRFHAYLLNNLKNKLKSKHIKEKWDSFNNCCS